MKKIFKNFIVILILIGISNSFAPQIYYDLYSFERLCEEWVENPERRTDIAKQFKDKNYLEGMKREKVIDILGNPTKIFEEDKYIYAFKRGNFLHKYDFLFCVTFKNNIVVETKVNIIDE